MSQDVTSDLCLETQDLEALALCTGFIHMIKYLIWFRLLSGSIKGFFCINGAPTKIFSYRHPRGVVSVGNLVQFHELTVLFLWIYSTVQKFLADLKNVAK